MVDFYGTDQALDLNAKLEFDRNKERYAFLRWGQEALDGFKAVPPDTGIVHQVNIEYLARVVFEKNGVLYPDSCFGTDSHTTMVNGIGVLGWGVGGIEAEAAMLGQPSSMLMPEVIGVRVTGKLAEGATATDLVLHRHADAARARRGREVRRVLRPRPRQPGHRRPQHDRQHGPGIWRHLRHLPDR